MSNLAILKNPASTWTADGYFPLMIYSGLSDVTLPRSINANFDLEKFTENFQIHKNMISQSSSTQEQPQALRYVRFSKMEVTRTWNSSENLYAAVADQYDAIEKQLMSLAKEDSLHKTVEEGAATSALIVVDHLKRFNLAPPDLSWHGGDAVVMLWSLGDTTYAITVTDGELGYVIRRNRKAVKIVDSIAMNSFQLSNLS